MRRYFILLFGAGLATAVAGAAPGGDPVAGHDLYAMCAGCHSLDRNRTGPRHCGVVGRKAGSVEGFAYSDAMRSASIVWTRDALERFLTDPGGMVPGTTMTWSGIPDPAARRDLIAYLEEAARSPECQ